MRLSVSFSIAPSKITSAAAQIAAMNNADHI
jgi:hypothetical protein